MFWLYGGTLTRYSAASRFTYLAFERLAQTFNSVMYQVYGGIVTKDSTVSGFTGLSYERLTSKGWASIYFPHPEYLLRHITPTAKLFGARAILWQLIYDEPEIRVNLMKRNELIQQRSEGRKKPPPPQRQARPRRSVWMRKYNRRRNSALKELVKTGDVIAGAKLE